MNDVEAIKAKLAIVDVVSSYVKLKKAGRSLKGLCPFHQEKTPSFIVSPDKDIAYCFGCRKGGDIFAFIQEIEGVDFPESLRLLAERAGVELTGSSGQATKSERDTLYEIQEAAASYFESVLHDQQVAETARAYLVQRGISDEAVQQFRLGYAVPEWDALVSHLRHTGYTDDQIIASGLGIARDVRTDGIYDRFRGRIMFPLYNPQGRLVGFSGRLLIDSDKEPKYLNSPDTAIFHKSSLLYGFPAARERIRSEARVLFVEGQMDVIALHQAGYTYAVATSGTALTADHLKLMKRYASTVLFSFDRDRAGIEATRRALALAVHQELTSLVVVLHGGKDPDEVVRTDPEMLAAAVSQPVDPISFYFDVYFSDADLSDLATKKAALQEVLAFVRNCVSILEQEHYLQSVSRRMGIALPVLQKEFRRFRVGRTVPVTVPSAVDEPTFRSAEDYLLGLMMQFPALIAECERQNARPEAFSAQFIEVYNLLREYYNAREMDFELKGFLRTFRDRSLATRMATLALLAEEQYGTASHEERCGEIHSLTALVVRRFARGLLQQLTVSLRIAETGGNSAEVHTLLQRKRDVIEQFEASS